MGCQGGYAAAGWSSHAMLIVSVSTLTHLPELILLFCSLLEYEYGVARDGLAAAPVYGDI